LLNSRDPPRHLDRCLSSGCHPFANLGHHQPHRGTDDPVMRQKPALAARSRWLSGAEGGGWRSTSITEHVRYEQVRHVYCFNQQSLSERKP